MKPLKLPETLYWIGGLAGMPFPLKPACSRQCLS